MSKSKILVVDDDPNLSRLIAVILKLGAGYEVTQENHSSAALETARRIRPDLIVMDVDMPGKDGGAVWQEISGDPKLAGTSVIFVSGLVSKGEAGMRGGLRYLSKPVDPRLLLDAVRAACPRFRPEKELAHA
jgi:DNA-binding response OmpR family regulator